MSGFDKGASLPSKRLTANEKAGDGKGEQDHSVSSVSLHSSNASEKKSSHPPSWKSYVALLILFVAYICVNLLGAVIFRAIERDPKAGTTHWFTETKSNFVKTHQFNLTMEALDQFLLEYEKAMGQDLESPFENETMYRYADRWTLSSGFLLSFTIASTIGYGVVTPRTPGGQAFTIFYALISIPFTGLLAAKLGSILAYFIKKAAAVIFKNRKSNQWVKSASIIFTFVVGLLVYIIIPSVVLTVFDNDEGWSFIECLYCIFVTLTTIGFGDYVPDPHSTTGMAGNVLVLVWVVAGLAWVATIVNLIANAITKQATTIKKKVARQQITMKSIKSATASIGGHRLRNKCKSKSSLDTSETGKDSIPGGKECDVETGKKDTSQRESMPSQNINGNSEHAEDDKGTPPTSMPTRLSDARRESNLSEGAKRDDVAFVPSGFMAIVVNNMENYDDNEEKEEAKS